MFKQKEAEVVARNVEEKAEAAKAKAWAVEVEATSASSWVVAYYKRSKDFKDEVSKAAWDAFQQGFTEAKKKVAKAFLSIDLANIMAMEPKQQEEGEEKEVMVGEAKDALVKKVKETK